MKNSLGIYIHIPFCHSKCAYCDFYSETNKSELQTEYIDALIKELDSYGIREYTKLDSLYLGGGTPSTLSLDELARLYQYFSDINIEESTIEVNPESVTKELLHLLKDHCVNRISMGVQSSDAFTLQLLGRIHNYQMVIDSYNLMRSIGFQNINLDLIYAINDDLLSLEKSIDNFLLLGPEHISTYELELYENRPLSRIIKKTSQDTSYIQFSKIKDKLEEKGYKRYEVSNFSKRGFESKHNQRYWKRQITLGIGASAHGLLGEMRYSHAPNIEQYIKDPCSIDKEDLSSNDIAFETLMLGLRIHEGIHLSHFKMKFPDYFDSIQNNIETHIKRNNLQIAGQNLKATDQGWDILNHILVDLMI